MTEIDRKTQTRIIGKGRVDNDKIKMPFEQRPFCGADAALKQIGENLKSGRSVRKDAFRLLALDTTKTLYTDSFRLIRLPLFHIFVCIS